MPLLLVFLFGHVAAGRIEEDGLVTEKPVAVPRAPNPADPVGPHRKVEPRIFNGGRFASPGRPYKHVPGQGVERILAVTAPPELRILERGDGLFQSAFEFVNFCLLVRSGALPLLLGLHRDRLFDLLGVATGPNKLDCDEAQPHHQQPNHDQ